MCKVDFKDAYLCVLLSEEDRKRVMFRWEGTLCQFLCLCFGLAPASYVFIKLLKIPMALFRRIGIRIVIYLDMLIIGRTREETITLRDSHSFTSVPRICYKSEQVSDDTSSGDRICGNDSQFDENDYFSSKDEITINKTDVSGSVSESRDKNFRIYKGVTSPDMNNFGHFPSKTTLLFSPTATNSGTEENWFLLSSVTKQRISIGASYSG